MSFVSERRTTSSKTMLNHSFLDETNPNQVYPTDVDVRIFNPRDNCENSLIRTISDDNTEGITNQAVEEIGIIQENIIDDESNSKDQLSDIPELPEGKDRHFFISYSSEDSEKVFPIVQDLEHRFSVSCVYADRDFQPGKDIPENIKDFMARSMLVLVFLSPNFNKSGFCKLEKDYAFMRSMEDGSNCIVPVLLETCEIPVTLKTLTYIDATKQDIDTPAKIVSALKNGDKGCLPYSEEYENGFSIVLEATPCTTSLIHRCARVPTIYEFVTDETFLQNLTRHKINISEHLLEKAISTVNADSVMWSYDYRRKRNIACWSVASIPFIVLLFIFVYYLSVVICASRAPFSEEDLNIISYTLTYLMFYTPPLFVVFVLLLICVWKLCRRKKRILRLQRKILNLYGDEFTDNNILLIYSGSTNEPPTLRIMRYNIKKCLDFLTELVKKKYPLYTNDQAKGFARSLIHSELEKNSLTLAHDFDSLPERPFNRHIVKKGKMCLCQMIERFFETDSKKEENMS